MGPKGLCTKHGPKIQFFTVSTLHKRENKKHA